jgi:ribosomal subunit interface protein
MNLRVSGKHMEIGEAFRSRIEGRIREAIGKYFDGGYSGQITVEKAGSRFSADCRVWLDSGISLQTTGEAMEPVPAFEQAADKFEKRLRRYKRRLKSHHTTNGDARSVDDVPYRVVANFAEDEEVAEDFAPAVVAESTVSLRTMSVAEAVIELDTKEDPVYVFRNAGNNQVNIVYRRPDGNIGWIDTASVAAA